MKLICRVIIFKRAKIIHLLTQLLPLQKIEVKILNTPCGQVKIQIHFH